MSGIISTKSAPGLEGLSELARLTLDGSNEAIERILSLARGALDMDVALVGAFDGDFVVQAVDGEQEWFDLEVGTRIPAEQTYCRRMVQGELPHLVQDAAYDERTASLPLTREAGIGAYVGVPIRLWDGTLYGTLCCLSRASEPSLNARDARFLHVLAEIVADQIDRGQLEGEKRKLEWSRVRDVLERDDIDIEFQPVFDLADCRIVSLEALARFWTEPMRSPSAWFAEANEVGLGVELELAAIKSALRRIDDFPRDVARRVRRRGRRLDRGRGHLQRRGAGRAAGAGSRLRPGLLPRPTVPTAALTSPQAAGALLPQGARGTPPSSCTNVKSDPE